MAGAQVTIRRANATDFAAIADLLNRSFEVERSHIVDEPETQSSVAAAMSRGGIYFVTVDSQGLIGCVYVDPGRRGIFKLAVEPSLRRQGHGRKLMAEAEKYGKDAGWPKVLAAILSFRSDLPEYYRDIGYVETGEHRPLVLEPPARALKPCHLIMMSKNLT